MRSFQSPSIQTKFIIRESSKDKSAYCPIRSFRYRSYITLSVPPFSLFRGYDHQHKEDDSPPHKALTPPIPNPPPIPINKLSLTHGYICTCLKSPSLTVWIASPKLGTFSLLPAVFCPLPSGKAFALGGGVEFVWKTS